MKMLPVMRWMAGMAAVVLSTAPAWAQVDFQKGPDNRIAITIDGQPFSTLYLGKDFPKPFMAPLMSASGEIVTRRFPMEKVEGESDDHQHHRGLFVGYGEINGLNFWENEFKYASHAPKNFNTAKNGLIVLKSIDTMKSGKKSGELVLTIDWNGPDKQTILEEHRTMKFHGGVKDMRIMDFDFTLPRNPKQILRIPRRVFSRFVSPTAWRRKTAD